MFFLFQQELLKNFLLYGNEEIFKCIEKLKKTFKIEALSIGKTVTMFLKEK